MKSFDTFSEAFDYCREGDSPVTVIVEGKRHKLFPSGHAKCLESPCLPECEREPSGNELEDTSRIELRSFDDPYTFA